MQYIRDLWILWILMMIGGGGTALCLQVGNMKALVSGKTAPWDSGSNFFDRIGKTVCFAFVGVVGLVLFAASVALNIWGPARF